MQPKNDDKLDERPPFIPKNHFLRSDFFRVVVCPVAFALGVFLGNLQIRESWFPQYINGFKCKI